MGKIKLHFCTLKSVTLKFTSTMGTRQAYEIYQDVSSNLLYRELRGEKVAFSKLKGVFSVRIKVVQLAKPL